MNIDMDPVSRDVSEPAPIVDGMGIDLNSKVDLGVVQDIRPAELQNETQSRLYRLPTELLLKIDEYVPPSGALALRLVCRKFYNIFGNKLQDIDERDMRAIRRLLKRQYFLCICARELECDEPFEMLCCSACFGQHARSEFSADEIAKPPEDRICRDAARMISLCKHKSMNRCEIMAAVDIDGPILERNIFTKCLDKSHDVVFNCPQILRTTKGKVFVISEYCVATTKLEAETISTDEIAKGLKCLDESICLHLRVRHLALRIPHPNIIPLQFQTVTSLLAIKQCLSCNCRTSFTLMLQHHRNTQDPKTLIVLYVQRSLGMFEDKKDEMWIAQSTDPTDDHKHDVKRRNSIA